MTKDISSSSDTSPPCGTFIFCKTNSQQKNKRATLSVVLQQQDLTL